MPAFVVTMRNGRKLTIQADEVRPSNDGFIQLLAPAPGGAGNRVVAVFDRGEVVCVVSREHLLAEEQGEPVPYSVGGNDAIPF